MALYAKYKVFVSSSLYEGNPKAVLEAMSMGCVVIAYKINNIEEIITQRANGILYEFDNKSLQKEIDYIFANEKTYEEIASAGKNYIKKENSFDLYKTKELKILKLLRT